MDMGSQGAHRIDVGQTRESALMEDYHYQLKHLIQQCWGDAFTIPPEWKAFVGLINDAFYLGDDDRAVLTRSLEMSSKEAYQADSEMQAGRS